MDTNKFAEQWVKSHYKTTINQAPFMFDFIKSIFINGFNEGQKKIKNGNQKDRNNNTRFS